MRDLKSAQQTLCEQLMRRQTGNVLAIHQDVYKRQAPELAAWAAAHPNGVIFGQKNQDLLTAEPQEVLRYMGKDWAIWPAAAATSRE